MKKHSSQSGMAVLLVILFLSVLAFSIASALAFASAHQQRIAGSLRSSFQAYYGAEAGIEDALLKLKNGWDVSNPLTLQEELFTASVEVTDVGVGGTREIVSLAERSNRFREVRVTYGMSTESISFYFGAHIGDGGLRMSNLSKVKGNVFSNGPITSSAGTNIEGSVQVAGTNILSGGNITENATAFVCQNSSIGGTLTVATNQGCTAVAIENLEEEVESLPLPITEQQIFLWKQEAEAGGIYEGNYTLSGSNRESIGPLKINGDINLSSSAQLTLTGVVWVTGKVNVNNLSIVQLSSGYGATGGVLISDSVITLQNLSESRGSGQDGSYLMYLSTSLANPAVVIKNNAKADILYTSAGWIEIQNNTKMRELTGYGVHTKNNAVLEYESGLTNSSFSSGPGGGWQVLSWEEVQ